MYVLTFQGMFCDSQSVSHIGSFESSYALPGNFFFYVVMVVLAFWLVLIWFFYFVIKTSFLAERKGLQGISKISKRKVNILVKKTVFVQMWISDKTRQPKSPEYFYGVRVSTANDIRRLGIPCWNYCITLLKRLPFSTWI